MTSAKAILLLAALQGAAGSAVAQRTAISQLFPAQPAGYVTDLTGTIAPDVSLRIRNVSERLRAATGAEIATVVLPTIGDREAVDVAVEIGRAWGVGAKAAVGDLRRNAGLVILLVPRRADDPNSGQIFIATGQGLEGIVTDLQAGRVRDLMRPYFSRGDYGAGLEAGIGSLAAMIARGMGVSDSALAAADRLSSPNGNSGGIPVGVIVVVIILVFIIIAANQVGPGGGAGRGGRGRRGPNIFWGGGFGGSGGGGGSWGGFGGGGGGGGFGGFGGGGGFSGGGAGGRF